MDEQLIIGVAAGALSALLVDLNAWLRNRETNHTLGFDWWLCIGRMISGSVTGLLTGWGIGAI